MGCFWGCVTAADGVVGCSRVSPGSVGFLDLLMIHHAAKRVDGKRIIITGSMNNIDGGISKSPVWAVMIFAGFLAVALPIWRNMIGIYKSVIDLPASRC